MSLAVELPDVHSGGPSADNCADLEALHREFYARLVRVCTQQLRDSSLAEDVAQDTILRALRFWGSYDAQRPTWPWLKTIALHLCQDARRARSHEVCLESMPDCAEATDRTERLLDEIMVRGAMAGLPERQRLALRLRYFDDRDRDTSAAVLGVNVNAFDQLLNRARLRLAHVIEPVRSGAPLGIVLFPLRWLRGRLPRHARGGAATVAMGTMTTIPLAVAPLLAIVAGMAPATASPSYPAAHLLTTPLAQSKAPARAARPAQRTGVRTGSAAPRATVLVAGATAKAGISSHPLGRGRVEGHGVRIVTPVTTVSVYGYDERDPATNAACGLPGVQCS